MSKFDTLTSDLFDLEEKHTRLTSIGVNSVINVKDGVSTGLLSIDLVIGGGLVRGREYEVTGPEHGGKTTLLYSCIGSAFKSIPNQLKGVFIDAEGEIDPVWFSNICGVSPEEVFGKKNKKGEWLIKPSVRYYKPAFGEQALKFLHRILKQLPNKVLVNDSWYYMWQPRDSKNKKSSLPTINELKVTLKNEYDKKLLAKYGNFYVPVENNYSGPELIIFVDSWAAMTPEAIAEDESNAIGSQARMFSKYLNNVKSLISAKGCVLFGTNQIRSNPMQMFGDPEYSPGGNTKKHTVDCRLRIGSLKGPSQKGMLAEEGQDRYRYFKIKNKKNKIAQPFKEAEGRWWIATKGGTGYGVDPVMDTIQFLKMTGQLSVKTGKNAGYYITFVTKKPSDAILKLSKTPLSYKELKNVILNPSSFFIDIRKTCIKQLNAGKAMKLYYNNTEEIKNDD